MICSIARVLRRSAVDGFHYRRWLHSAVIFHENVSESQVEYLKENCIAVDEEDRIIGAVSKADSHRKETAILHRAFSVFIFNSKQELLLQRRAASKITFPNRWTNACCSHPLYNTEEAEEKGSVGVRRAAVRKLEHELGVSPAHYSINDFDFVGRYIYAADSDENWTEHELDHVLILKNFSANLAVNPDEVSATKFVTYSQLNSMLLLNPCDFSPWFSLLHSSGWLARWWKDLSDLSAYDNSKIHRLN